MQISFEQQQDIIKEATVHALDIAADIRATNKIKRGQYLYHQFSIAFTVSNKFVAVIMPLIVERRDTKMLWSPVVQEITEDDYLDIVKQSQK